MLKGLESIEGLTDEQREAIEGLTVGLVSKKSELEEKLSRLKSDSKGSTAELERLRLLEADLERSKLEDKENYQGALTLKEQEYKKNLDKLTSENGDDKKLIHKLLVENGLKDELVKLDVNKDLMELIQQGFSSQATVVDGKAMIGEKSLSEYMTAWAETPTGKASRVAPSNSNGDAIGGDTVPKGKKMSDLTGIERTALFRTDRAEFDRLKAEQSANT